MMDVATNKWCIADYAVQIFHDALKTAKFQSFLRADTRLPMMYISDALRSLCEFMALPPESLKQRTYNVTAMSFTPHEIAESVKRHVPQLQVSYAPDYRQPIGTDSYSIN